MRRNKNTAHGRTVKHEKILIIEDDSAIAEIEKITSRFPAWMRQSSLMEKRAGRSAKRPL